MKPLEAKLRVSAETQQAQGALQRLRAGVQSISETLQQARAQTIAFFAAQLGVRQLGGIAELADSYASLSARLRIATQSQAEFSQALRLTRQLAGQYKQPLAETSVLYTRMLGALRPLGGGIREASVATEGLLAALRISGASAAESGSAILQFGQALGAGALRGEEFNAIAEAAPRLLDALAAGLGRPRSELKALAEQGRLTSGAVVQAIARELPRLRDEARSIPETIGSATLGVRNAMLQLVGASAEGSEGVRLIVGALNLLRDNLDKVLTALAALAVGLAAMKLGALAQALWTAGRAAAAAAGGVAVLGAALRAALGLIGGPVGWVVALTSAAAAWLSLGAAKQKAAERTRDVVQRELADAQAELATARAAAARAGAAGTYRGQVFGDRARVIAPDTRGAQARHDQIRAEARVRRLEQELAQSERSRIDQLLADAGPRGRTEEAELANPRASLDAEGRATRVAQAKAEFDAELALLADMIEREKTYNQARYDEGLSDLQSYLRRREQLEDEEVQLQLRRLQQQLAAEDEALAANRQRLARAKPGNDREGLAEAVAAAEGKRADLQVQIEKTLRDQEASEQARLRLVRDVNRELAAQRQALRGQLEDAQGEPLSRERLRERALEANQGTLERFRRAGDRAGSEQVLKLVDLQVTQAELQQLEALVSRTQGRLAQGEGKLRREVSAGTLTSAEAEAELLRLRQEQLPVLEELHRKMEALAVTPADRQRVSELRERIAELQGAGSELERTLRGQAITGLQQMFADIASGAKSAKDGLLDMVRSFARAMLDMLARNLAERLVKQFLQATEGTAGAGSGGGFAALASWVGSLFHSGGVVGAGGGVRRRMPAAAFAFAPRYHSGGIAGLADDEVPAVLRRGEEVLTADDPRHVRNLRAAAPVIGALNVSVSVDGGGAASADAGMARELAQLIRAKIDEGIAQQMRPGGLLARR